MSDDELGDLDPATAFEGLRAEVAQVRRALEASRAPPDYTATLGALDRGLKGLQARLDRIEAHPGLRLTPEEHARQMVQAGDRANRELKDEFSHARTGLYHVTGELKGALGQARERERQEAWVLGALGAGFVLGVVVWVVLSGPFARSLPASWAVPEKMAAATVASDRWSAGSQIMASAHPQDWKAVLAADALVKANQAAIEACRQRPRSKGTVSCAIAVKAEGDGFGRLTR